MASAADILAILDTAADDFTFPMLDHGYTYLAATRLHLFRDSEDWGLVIETFGYSVRAGLPDIFLYVFGSGAHGQPGPDQHQCAFPVDDDTWIDQDDSLAVRVLSLPLRGRAVSIPTDTAAYADVGIQLEGPLPRVHEACRWLAAVHRDEVLASPPELSACVAPQLSRILTLEAWHHPDVADERIRPSTSECFRQLAAVLETGDLGHYQPTEAANTHWSHWPAGGTL